MTLLMSTEELLAVLADGVAAAPSPEPRRLRVVPDPGAPAVSLEPAPAAPSAPRPPALFTGRPSSTRPGLMRRLQCARHGHDPRPHRPRPHDEIVYRCLRCGRPTPPPTGG